MADAGLRNPQDVVIDGLTSCVELTPGGQPGCAQACGMILQDVAAVFRAELRPADLCLFAMPAMLITDRSPVHSILAVLPGRVMIAFKSRRRLNAIVLPTAAIHQIVEHRSDQPRLRAARLLTFTGPASATVALPVEHAAAVAAAVRHAVTASAQAGAPAPPPAPQPAAPPSPAGWDPAGHHQVRYFDGQHWTARAATGTQQYTDPI